MNKAILIVIFLNLGIAFQTVAQSFHINHLFNPGLTIGTDYQFHSEINDSTDFQIVKYKVQFVKPVKTKFGVALKDFDIKKVDAKASQIFLATKFSLAKPSITNNNYEDIYKGEIELTAITASIKNGIWVYAGNIYFEESSTTFKKYLTPNLRAYTAYINIKHLKFIYFYGATMVINQGRFYPLPLFGFRAKLTSQLKAEVIIPVHIKLNYELNKKINFDLAGYFSGINAIDRQGSVLKKNDNTLNLRELKTYLAINAKLAKHYKMKAEVGYAYSQKIHALSNDFEQNMSSAPYASISLNYNFGNSVFGNFIDRTE